MTPPDILKGLPGDGDIRDGVDDSGGAYALCRQGGCALQHVCNAARRDLLHPTPEQEPIIQRVQLLAFWQLVRCPDLRS